MKKGSILSGQCLGKIKQDIAIADLANGLLTDPPHFVGRRYSPDSPRVCRAFPWQMERL